MHSKRFAYDHVYLFECEPEHLSSSETAVITELCPIYNRMKNPQAEKYRSLLDIDYNAVQNADQINRHLKLYAEYEKKGLFGFSLPRQVYSALEEEALIHGYTCSELLQEILEKEIVNLYLGKEVINIERTLEQRANIIFWLQVLHFNEEKYRPFLINALIVNTAPRK